MSEKALCFTVRSTFEQRHDPEWRHSLNVDLMEFTDVTITDIGGGSGFGEGLVADNDFEAVGDGAAIFNMVDRLRAQGRTISVWENQPDD